MGECGICSALSDVQGRLKAVDSQEDHPFEEDVSNVALLNLLARVFNKSSSMSSQSSQQPFELVVSQIQVLDHARDFGVADI